MIRRRFRIPSACSWLGQIWRCIVLTIILLGIAAAQAQPFEKLSPAQQVAIQAMIHDYLLAHPEIVAQAMQEEQQKEQLAQEIAARANIATDSTDLLNDPNTPVIGNPHGSITLIEFADDQCPYCKAMVPIIDGLIAKNQKLRVIVKDLPILGPESAYAARVGLLAFKEGRYGAYRSAIAAQSGPLNQQDIWDAALAAGLNVKAAKAEIDASWINSELAEDTKLAKSLRIEGTPAFIVGNVLIDGGTSEGHLQALLSGESKSPGTLKGD